ncbi:AraC family transcriptional regulator [Leptospira sarikeiensis]|uniref:AraC family transcriptional regulator n=1 Tax=Leptospira sarikeiensis TaxID=2484943 RepID=A0A4R9K8P7_9LEPT|nr:AraC family transcriptional regulator [Leptospira sarikeiensis]TGL62067.1 AraC family transcriptional regulator [Leptospira sarikeiensis]
MRKKIIGSSDPILTTNQKVLDQIIPLTEKFGEGRTETVIPFLSVIRRSNPTSFVPGVLTPSFCLIVQGAKKIHLGKEKIQYYAGDFVASLIDMPAQGHVMTASKSKPFISLRIDFTKKEIADVISEAGIHVKPRDNGLNSAAFVGKTDPDILELFVKLLKLLDKPEESLFVSELVKREMIFRLMKGEYGHLFFQPVIFDKKVNGVGKVIEWIKNNYATPFTVEKLAKIHNMSVSGLHQKFKTITTMSPLQYQKQLRLQEARRLILSGSADAASAAFDVGYESPSQFSREYKRLFGQPPMKDIKSLRKSPGLDPSI